MNARVVAAFLTPIILLPLIAYLLIDHGRSNTRRVGPGQLRAGAVLVQQRRMQGLPSRRQPGDRPASRPFLRLAGQPAALEDPSYAYVVAGDPEKSFLYLKVAGFGDAGQVGRADALRQAAAECRPGRAAPRLDPQGARGPDGQLPPRVQRRCPASPTCPTCRWQRRRPARARSPAGGRPAAAADQGRAGDAAAARRRPARAARSTTGWRRPARTGGTRSARFPAGGSS